MPTKYVVIAETSPLRFEIVAFRDCYQEAQIIAQDFARENSCDVWVEDRDGNQV